MRVFTDGSCTANGQKNAKAGYAVWFPEHPGLSESHRVPDDKAQTNQRAELSAIHRAAQILDLNGCDEDVVVYTDSAYSISCLTEWIAGWVARNWKTSAGKDVLHRDLIEETATLLSKRKSHKFVHVKAHTSGTDEHSKWNRVADELARNAVDAGEIVRYTSDVKVIRNTEPSEFVLPGIPLAIMGAPISELDLVRFIRENLDSLEFTALKS